MNHNNLNKKLKQLDNEDFIWIIYLGIIILSWYSNSLERNYYKNNDQHSKDVYQEILIFIFSIVNVVYFYFLNDSINSINELKINDSKKKKDLTYLSFIASLFISISGIILLYIAINNNDLDVELAFN